MNEITKRPPIPKGVVLSRVSVGDFERLMIERNAFDLRDDPKWSQYGQGTRTLVFAASKDGYGLAWTWMSGVGLDGVRFGDDTPGAVDEHIKGEPIDKTNCMVYPGFACSGERVGYLIGDEVMEAYVAGGADAVFGWLEANWESWQDGAGESA